MRRIVTNVLPVLTLLIGLFALGATPAKAQIICRIAPTRCNGGHLHRLHGFAVHRNRPATKHFLHRGCHRHLHMPWLYHADDQNH